MAEVIRFPGLDARRWAAIENIFRVQFEEGNISKACEESVLAVLKQVYDEHIRSLDIEIPAGCTDQVTATIDKMNAFYRPIVSSLFVEIAKREIELYFLRNDKERS